MLSHPSWSAEPTASQARIACYGLLCQQTQSPSLVHSLAGRRPGIRPAYYPSSGVTTSTRPFDRRSAEDHGSLHAPDRAATSSQRYGMLPCARSMRLREGKTHVTVLLLAFWVRVPKVKVRRVLGLFTTGQKAGQPSRTDRLEGKQASFRLCRSRGNR